MMALGLFSHIEDQYFSVTAQYSGCLRVKDTSRSFRKCSFGREPIEDSDQPAHSYSLIRIFTGCILDS